MVQLEFPAGLYNLARPTPMKKGDWAWGVDCKNCGSHIFCLKDGSNGRGDPSFTGEGDLAIPCRTCFTDSTYKPADLRLFLLDTDIPDKQELKPSGVFRRPRSEAYPDARIVFGPGFLHDRPEAAAQIGRCIGLWAEVEASCAGLITNFLGARSGPATAMFLAIRNSRTQLEALVAAAEVSLEPEMLRLFRALLAVKYELEEERNRLAHGHFGGAVSMRRGVAWVSVADHARSVPLNEKQVYVYEPEDLETLALAIQSLIEAFGSFSICLNPSLMPGWRESKLQSLSAMPRVRAALSRLDGQQKSRGGKRGRSPKDRPHRKPQR